MSERNRQYLKQEFQDGERPSGEDFADLMDSFLNITDDGLSIDLDSNLLLSRGLSLGDSNSNLAGTLRFNSNQIQYHNGTTWVNLASGSGGAFQPIGTAGAVAYAGGNVGIGNFTTAPTHRLEVELGENTGEAERVRFGAAAIFGSEEAYFAHRNHTTSTNFGFRQEGSGRVRINAPEGQPIRFDQGGNQPRLTITTNGNVIVGSSRELEDSTARFQVNGSAGKNDGRDLWDRISDVTVKEDIRDLEAGLDQLMQVRPVRFRYNGKAGTPCGEERVGIIGQEIEKIFPEMVRRIPNTQGLDNEELLIYNGSDLIYVLVNAVKELSTKVKHLESILTDFHNDNFHANYSNGAASDFTQISE